MTDYIKREDAIFIALQQPFFQNSMATEIRQIKGIDIVRCKECRWLDKGENESCSWSMCTRHFGQYINVDDEAFCSYGERSEP